jgi:hypothetical protein
MPLSVNVDGHAPHLAGRLAAILPSRQVAARTRCGLRINPRRHAEASLFFTESTVFVTGCPTAFRLESLVFFCIAELS